MESKYDPRPEFVKTNVGVVQPGLGCPELRVC
jgi:hypothetical protein